MSREVDWGIEDLLACEDFGVTEKPGCSYPHTNSQCQFAVLEAEAGGLLDS